MPRTMNTNTLAAFISRMSWAFGGTLWKFRMSIVVLPAFQKHSPSPIKSVKKPTPQIMMPSGRPTKRLKSIADRGVIFDGCARHLRPDRCQRSENCVTPEICPNVVHGVRVGCVVAGLHTACAFETWEVLGALHPETQGAGPKTPRKRRALADSADPSPRTDAVIHCSKDDRRSPCFAVQSINMPIFAHYVVGARNWIVGMLHISWVPLSHWYVARFGEVRCVRSTACGSIAGTSVGVRWFRAFSFSDDYESGITPF